MEILTRAELNSKKKLEVLEEVNEQAIKIFVARVNTQIQKGLLAQDEVRDFLNEEVASFSPVLVVEDDLSKRLVFIRPVQVGSIEKSLNADSVFLRTDRNIKLGIDGLPSEFDIIKGKRAAIGEIRYYGGVPYQKVSATGNAKKDWKVVKDMVKKPGAKGGEKHEEAKEEKLVKEEELGGWEDVVMSSGIISRLKVGNDKYDIYHESYPKAPKGEMSYYVKKNGDSMGIKASGDANKDNTDVINKLKNRVLEEIKSSTPTKEADVEVSQTEEQILELKNQQLLKLKKESFDKELSIRIGVIDDLKHEYDLGDDVDIQLNSSSIEFKPKYESYGLVSINFNVSYFGDKPTKFEDIRINNVDSNLLVKSPSLGKLIASIIPVMSNQESLDKFGSAAVAKIDAVKNARSKEMEDKIYSLGKEISALQYSIESKAKDAILQNMLTKARSKEGIDIPPAKGYRSDDSKFNREILNSADKISIVGQTEFKYRVNLGFNFDGKTKWSPTPKLINKDVLNSKLIKMGQISED